MDKGNSHNSHGHSDPVFGRVSSEVWEMIAQELAAPTVRIKLDKWRTLTYGYEAHAAIQKVTGRKMLESDAWKNILVDITENLNAELLRQVIWAGLLAEDDSVTLDDVKTWARGKSHILLQTKFLKALTASTVQADKEMTEDEETDRPPQDSQQS